WEAQPVQEHYVQKGDPRPIQDFWRYDVIPAWNKHQRQAQVDVQDSGHMSTTLDTPASVPVMTRAPETVTLLTEADWKIVAGYESFIDRWINNNKMALDPRT